MKKHLFAFLLASLTACSLFAGTISVQTAQTVAINFFKNTDAGAALGNMPTASLKFTKTEPNGDIDFYIFDIGANKGFVIVSADDNVEPVIGYSTEGNFPADIKGSPINDWIKTTSLKIRSIVQNNVLADNRIMGLWSGYQQGITFVSSRAASVSPLLTTTWNQNPYYNNLCPLNTTDNQRAVTGCVATAMAQIMKYWNYPAHGTGSYSYNDAPPNYSYNYGVQSANFGATTYNWGNMPNAITSTNATDIATLMYHCGVAVAMDYGDLNEGGSGAYVLGTSYPSAQKAFGTYFGYNASAMQGIYQANYTTANWITALQNELNAGRPIQYMGFDPGGGGHTWVCDGYDANSMFHMNWGWGGYGNGYFSVTNLSVAGYAFNSDDAALIGIQPLNGTQTCNAPTGLTSSSISSTGATVSWNAASGASSYNLQYKATSASTWTTVSVSGSTSKALTGLTAGTSYNFQVQTVCSSGSSGYSTAATFTTTGSCGTPASMASSSVTTNSATISWGAVSGATTYNLQYKTSSGSTWTTVSTSSTSYGLTGLAAGTTYNCQVQSVCSSGSSAYTSVGSFTTLTGCGTPASMVSSSVTTNSATISWGAVSGATTYNLQYKTSSGSTWTTVSTSSTSYGLTGLASGTTYNCQVQSVCSSGSSAYTGVGSFTTTSSAGCGIATGLAVNSLTTNSAILVWLAVTGGLNYNLQYKASTASTWTTVAVTGIAYTCTGLTPGTTYNFQVQSNCSSGSSSYSTPVNFTTLTSCGTPSGLASSGITTTTASVSWGAVSGATSYNLQYKTSAGTTWTTIPTGTTSLGLTGLVAGTTYNFQVQTICSSGSSAYSAAASFTTVASGTVSYCTSKASSTAYEYIKTITVGSFTNTSGSNTGYGTFTNLTIPMSSGTTKSLTLTPGFSTSSMYPENWAVYIDYNKNGSFTDAGEKVYSSSPSSLAVNGSFTVPTGLSGTTTMRVIMSFTAVSSPCGSFSFGETEDYTVNFSLAGAVGALIDDEPQSYGSDNEEVTPAPLIYPNPATNQVSINLTPVDDLPMKVEIISITGQVVAAQIAATEDRIATINLSDLAPGVYLVRSYTGDRARTEKLIKQ